jgi:hypothetical protein
MMEAKVSSEISVCCYQSTWHHIVTVRMSLNFIVGCWGYTCDREDRVSGERSVTILHSSYKSRDSGKNDTGTERERERVRE